MNVEIGPFDPGPFIKSNTKENNMHPRPCAHCGQNFMKPVIDPVAPNLCNSCTEREEKRNPRLPPPDSVSILVNCPVDMHREIEEYCMAHGLSYSTYFVRLHIDSKQPPTAPQIEETFKTIIKKTEEIENETPVSSKPKGRGKR